jgi:hypothetical protein
MREVVVASTGYGSKQRIVVWCTLLVLGGGALGYGCSARSATRY